MPLFYTVVKDFCELTRTCPSTNSLLLAASLSGIIDNDNTAVPAKGFLILKLSEQIQYTFFFSLHTLNPQYIKTT